MSDKQQIVEALKELLITAKDISNEFRSLQISFDWLEYNIDALKSNNHA
jgi:hypothetical protein